MQIMKFRLVHTMGVLFTPVVLSVLNVLLELHFVNEGQCVMSHRKQPVHLPAVNNLLTYKIIAPLETVKCIIN